MLLKKKNIYKRSVILLDIQPGLRDLKHQIASNLIGKEAIKSDNNKQRHLAMRKKKVACFVFGGFLPEEFSV